LTAEVYAALRAALDEERLVTLVTVIAGAGIGSQLLVRPDGGRVGSLGGGVLDKQTAELVRQRGDRLTSERRTLDALELFIETLAPRPKLVVVGGVHAAVALVSCARALGYRTYVVDPRGAFATPERFGHADAIVREWPQQALATIGLNETTYVAVLTHDFKIDVPALVTALRSPARYVGVLGSRRTHAKRVAALQEAGLTADEIARIRTPIGLDIGARTPEEIAVAIIAEIVAVARRESAV
jgi:xanthine dehydrogenase accessory factor